MAVHRLYISQTSFNGSTYTVGTPIDTKTAFNVVCAEVPFKLYEEAKDVVTKDWKGSHGMEVYIPSSARIKDYDLEIRFLYTGTHANMRNNVSDFVSFLYGLNYNSIGARLAMYDEETRTGRKDVRLVNVKYGTWWDEPDCDDEAIADFTCKFNVYDPMTDVTPTFTNNVLTGLTWAQD